MLGKPILRKRMLRRNSWGKLSELMLRKKGNQGTIDH